MKSRIQLYYLLSSLVLLRGLFWTFNLENLVKLLCEGIILIWFFLEVSKSRQEILLKAAPFAIAFSYLLWTGLISLVFNESILEYYLYSRYFILGFLMMLICFNSNSLKRLMRSFLKSIDFFVFVQFIACLILFLSLGRLERYVGTMSSSGGSLATVWPLTFAPFFFLRYVVRGRRLDLFLLITLIFMGYASGKRAVYFLIPVSIFTILIFYLGWGNLLKSKKSFIRVIYSVVFLFVFLLLGISGTESLSQSNGFSLKSISTAISYAGEYSNQESAINGESIGRSGSTFNTINGLFNKGNVLFGNGLKSLKGEISFSKYDVGYGITGLIRELISLGLVGGLLYLLFFVSLFLRLRSMRSRILKFHYDSDLFWIWILAGTGLVAILITYVGYSRVFSQTLNPLIFIMMCVGISENGVRRKS